MARLPLDQSDVLESWGGPARIQHYPLEEPIVLSRVSTSMTREANRYYTEWVRPQGLFDAGAQGAYFIGHGSLKILAGKLSDLPALMPKLGDAFTLVMA